MLAKPMDILTEFPIRKTKEQKQAFRNAVQDYLSGLGYAVTVETGGFGVNNLIVGAPETAAYLVTAGDAPSGVLLLLEIARTLPKIQRNKACFALFDSKNLGPGAYCKTHQARQLVLHLGDISGGDQIRMIPTKKLKDDRKRLTSLYKACGYFGKKSLLVEEEKTHRGYDPFPYAVHIRTIQKKTGNTSIDATNINILRAALTTLITCDS